MTPEKENILYDIYPEIFQEKDLPPQVTAMCWGIDCDDGWFNILYDLCSSLARIQKASGMHIVATQVKEKFGSLRFYYEVEPPEALNTEEFQHEKMDWLNIIQAVVQKAQDESFITCEITGGIGFLCVKDHLYKTLSSKKAQELGYTPTSRQGIH